MIVVGALIVVLAALVVTGLMLSPGGETQIDFYGIILPNLSARSLVLTGVVLTLIVLFGLWLIKTSTRRWLRARKNRRSEPATPELVEQ